MRGTDFVVSGLVRRRTQVHHKPGIVHVSSKKLKKTKLKPETENYARRSFGELTFETFKNFLNF